MNEREAYAMGYFYGRAMGSDEAGIAEFASLTGDERGPARQAWGEGYERGVADYCEFDIATQDSDLDDRKALDEYNDNEYAERMGL
jgi:ABC-type sugar transport system substrate-binding protein